jgi:hypothetical protein
LPESGKPDFDKTGQNPTSARIWQFVPESDKYGWNSTILCQISVSLAGIWPFVPDSSHFHRNPANPNSDETGMNMAIAAGFQPPSPESGNSSRNQVKVVGILPASNGISSPVTFCRS